MTTNADKLAALSPAKRALVERMLREKSGPQKQGAILCQSERTGFVLSSSQQRLWFLQQFEPGSAHYNSPLLVKFRGPLNEPILQQALNGLVARHEVLRTSYEWENDRPIQRPLPTYSVDLLLIEDVDDSWASIEATRPFDLSTGVMLRAALHHMSSSEHMVLLNVPHIATDGWSRRLMLRDLSELYNAYLLRSELSLPTLPIQYGDYAVWQQAALSSPEARKHLIYWKHQLAGLPALCSFITDHPRPSSQSYRGKLLRFHIPSHVHQSLENLAHENGATLFMTVLAAFQTLIYRYTGQNDIVVGSPIAGRTQPETEELIGCFINTLVLRADLSDELNFRDALLQVRQTCLEAYEHQDLPFEKLVEELQPERNLSQSPLVQLMLVLQNAPKREFEFSGLMCQAEEVHTGTSKVDLLMNLNLSDDGISGEIEFSTDLFDPTTIQAMIGHFELLLHEISQNPYRGLQEYNLLSDEEEQSILVEFNSTAADFPKDQCVHRLIEKQAVKTPNRPAVVFEDAQITYRELDARANQVAHTLKDKGVGSGVLVGLCVERSIEAVIGIIGIMKAGGAYLPIDPSHPQERIAGILRDAEVSHALSHKHLAGLLSAHGVDTTIVDCGCSSLGLRPGESVEVPDDPGRLAYVIYTSGSTGAPKGVEITHSALMNLLTSMRREPGLAEGEIFLAVSPFTFDIATLEILLPLIVGATVVVAGRAVATDGASLARMLVEVGATAMQATPATWRMMIESGWTGNSVLKVFCGGEALPPELAVVLREGCASLWNLYGPTETTIYSTGMRVERVNGTVPIGKPLANTRLYILNSKKSPVPIGVAGELYIAGVGLSLGYRNRPDLTAERFVSCPFGAGNMYRTGDLARWSRSGEVEYLGRLDHQVKIRGYRIELGEIESVLSSSPLVQSCAVVARGDTPGDQRIVAYIVPTGEPDSVTLRSLAKQQLPLYMVPTAFVFLDSLPLNANGKLDRIALPLPGASGDSGDIAYTAPSDSLEERLCCLWSDVLRVDRLGVQDNFFDFGGHSLLAIRLLNLVNKEYELTLSLGEIFQMPTVGSMACLIRQRKQQSSAWSPLVPMRLQGDLSPLFCAPAGGGSAFYYQTLVSKIGLGRPVYAFEPLGMNGADEPHKTIEEMACYYIEHLRLVQQVGPYYLCGLSLGGLVALEMARQLSMSGDEIAALILLDTRAPGGYKTIVDNSPSSLTNSMRGLCFKLASHAEDMSARPTLKERIGYIRSRLVGFRKGKYINPVHMSLPDQFERVMAADRQSCLSYNPDSYSGEVVLLRARLQDPSRKTDSTLGWGHLLPNLTVVHTQGTHFSMLEEPCVNISAKHVRRILDERTIIN